MDYGPSTDSPATALIQPSDPSGSIFGCTRHRVQFTPRSTIPRPSPFVLSQLREVIHPDVLQIRTNGLIGLWEARNERSWVIAADLRGVSPAVPDEITWLATARCRFLWNADRLKVIDVILPSQSLRSIFRILGSPLGKGLKYSASLTSRLSPASIRFTSPLSLQLWIDAFIHPPTLSLGRPYANHRPH